MIYILSIETTSPTCSVTLSANEQVVAYKENEGNNHSEVLAAYINDVIQQAGISVNDLDAVAVSKGPGSYTGLRIGTSTAKGLCYALDKPLIAVDTLYALALAAHAKYPQAEILCPMIDARRMEVYTAAYDNNMNKLLDVKAKIIDKNSFSAFLERGYTVFLGSGAMKTTDIITSANAHFDNKIYCSSLNMVPVAMEKYNHDDFEDVAYFEPFYLKEFVARKSVNKILSLQNKV